MSNLVFRIVMTVVVAVAVLAGVGIGAYAAGAFDKPDQPEDTTCFWAENLGYDSISSPDC